MKVYSYKAGPIEGFSLPEFLEGYQPEMHVHLGTWEGREYFSYDPEFVKVQDAESAEYKFFDTKKKDDKEFLNSIVNNLHFMRQQIVTKKAELFQDIDMFDVISGLASQDKYVLEKIKTAQKSVDEILKNYGF